MLVQQIFTLYEDEIKIYQVSHMQFMKYQEITGSTVDEDTNVATLRKLNPFEYISFFLHIFLHPSLTTTKFCEFYQFYKYETYVTQPKKKSAPVCKKPCLLTYSYMGPFNRT
jgi:hypothetical protein